MKKKTQIIRDESIRVRLIPTDLKARPCVVIIAIDIFRGERR